MSFIAELKRRNVFRVGLAYVLMGWVLLQGTDFVLDLIGAPDWVIRVFALAVAVGLPIALFFAWAFEVTPEGIKREADIERTESITGNTGRRLDKLIIGFLALAVVILVAERFVSNPAEPPPEAVAAPEQSTPEALKSIAVLPFRDMSQAGDQAYFGEGIAEELLNALVKIDGLKVASRTSAFSLADDDLDIPSIAQRLDVGNILEGSIRTSGNQVRVTAQLINVEDDTHLWSETYNGTLDDIFRIQDEITAQILAGLRVQLAGASPQTSTEQLTDNPEAYRLYLQARSLWRMRNTASLRQADALLKEALVLDPGFHKAISLSALVLMNITDYDTNANYEELINQSIQTARRALAIEPNSIEAQLVLADSEILDCRFTEAFGRYEVMLKDQPNDPTPYHWYALILHRAGYQQKALQLIRQAKAIDPLISAIVATEGIILRSMGDFAASIALSREAAALGFRSGNQEEIIGTEILLGNLDNVDQLIPPESNPNFKYTSGFVAALKDRSRQADFEDLIFSQPEYSLNDTGTLTGYLAFLGSTRMPEFMSRQSCIMIPETIWIESAREVRGTPEFFDAMEGLGIAEVWREYGWPDDCESLDPTRVNCPSD